MAPVLKIGDRLVGPGHPVYKIAEIGINHDGDVNKARRLMKMAKECGADCVKFQKRTISRILTKEGLERPYNSPNSWADPEIGTYGNHKEKLELSETEFRELRAYADELEIDFAASCWDEDACEFVDELDPPFFKMASADLTNFPLLEHTAKKGRPMIISTGMSDFAMVKAAVELISKYNTQIAILQCTSTYPTPADEINLNVIKTYMEEFPEYVIGYSGHEKGISITLAAVVLGCSIIERHFTDDRTAKGSDHAASLEGNGFYKVCRDCDIITAAMGSPIKTIQPSEEPCIKKLRKSIVSAAPIPAGTVITREMLTVKGPGTGLCPSRIEEIGSRGAVATRDIPEDVVITEEDIV